MHPRALSITTLRLCAHHCKTVLALVANANFASLNEDSQLDFFNNVSLALTSLLFLSDYLWLLFAMVFFCILRAAESGCFFFGVFCIIS